MNLKDRIELLSVLGKKLQKPDEKLDAVIRRTYHGNRWFTVENTRQAIDAICTEFLDKKKLTDWAEKYDGLGEKKAKTVALVMAGNIPLVGFHDWLSVFLAGHRAQIKLSSKDKYLLPFIFDFLADIEPRTKEYITVVERLEVFDAVIATGSDNSARYFDTYFGKYPNIIRRNRTSVAILTGKETDEDFDLLGQDLFNYFGLGCRNVSKIYVPEDFDFPRMMERLHEFKELVLHHKYKNNFDYNFSLLILNKIPIYSNGCLLVYENDSLHSRIAGLHYSKYKKMEDLTEELSGMTDKLQCIVSGVDIPALNTIGFGETQQPSLSDYADGVDTLEFLAKL